MEDAFRRVVPTQLRFSPDGKRLISETDAGGRTIYDSQTGRTLQHAHRSSVGVFKSLLMIALREVPTDVTAFTLKITPSEHPVHVSRRTDGRWQVGKADNYLFKVDGPDFVSYEGGVEKKEDILTMLGLKKNANLAEVTLVKHSLGVIKITRKETGLAFRLKDRNDQQNPGETIQASSVQWGTSSKE